MGKAKDTQSKPTTNNLMVSPIMPMNFKIQEQETTHSGYPQMRRFSHSRRKKKKGKTLKEKSIRV